MQSSVITFVVYCRVQVPYLSYLLFSSVSSCVLLYPILWIPDTLYFAYPAGCTTVFYNYIFCYILLFCANSCVLFAVISCYFVLFCGFCFAFFFVLYPAASAIFRCFLFIRLFLLLISAISCCFCYILPFSDISCYFLLYPAVFFIICCCLFSISGYIFLYPALFDYILLLSAIFGCYQLVFV